jgi:hypothetical protein
VGQIRAALRAIVLRTKSVPATLDRRSSPATLVPRVHRHAQIRTVPALLGPTGQQFAAAFSHRRGPSLHPSELFQELSNSGSLPGKAGGSPVHLGSGRWRSLTLRLRAFPFRFEQTISVWPLPRGIPESTISVSPGSYSRKRPYSRSVFQIYSKSCL